MSEYLTISEASVWASEYLEKNVTSSNISNLIQYRRITKIGDNGSILIAKEELNHYYKSQKKSKQESWKDELGEDLNWTLSFDQYKESETTKHVHRLHLTKENLYHSWLNISLTIIQTNLKRKFILKKGTLYSTLFQEVVLPWYKPAN